jgi:tRNA 2-thiouridine synthesizing protein A
VIDDEGGVAVETERRREVVYDAGDLSCGELVMELRRRLLGLPPGTVLAVRATDPAAPLDIPAWCHTTGHALVEERHPLYRIRRKED